VRSDRAPRRHGVRDGNHQSNRSSEALGEGDPFQLCRAQLSLEVAQTALDLNQDRLIRAAEDHVRSATVWREANGDLQAHLPRGMRGCPDLLCDRQLPRIPQPDAIGGEESHGKAMSNPASKARD
jgi:hypothetical protein